MIAIASGRDYDGPRPRLGLLLPDGLYRIDRGSLPGMFFGAIEFGTEGCLSMV